MAHGIYKAATCHRGVPTTAVYNRRKPRCLPNRRGPWRLDLKPLWVTTVVMRLVVKTDKF
jgi:hypothetical protein